MQTSLFKTKDFPKEFGGELLKGRRKSKRPLSTKRINPDCPADSATPLSKLSFSWVTPLLKTSHGEPITENDLWNMPAKVSMITRILIPPKAVVEFCSILDTYIYARVQKKGTGNILDFMACISLCLWASISLFWYSSTHSKLFTHRAAFTFP